MESIAQHIQAHLRVDFLYNENTSTLSCGGCNVLFCTNFEQKSRKAKLEEKVGQIL
jgi:hypothetical protein